MKIGVREGKGLQCQRASTGLSPSPSHTHPVYFLSYQTCDQLASLMRRTCVSAASLSLTASEAREPFYFIFRKEISPWSLADARLYSLLLSELILQ